jgi:cell division septal protein FtsQ
MALLPRTRPKRPWLVPVRLLVVAVLVLAAGWGTIEISQRFLGLQRLTVEQVSVSGTRGARLAQAQAIAERICLGSQLFWMDTERLRAEITALRWVRGVLIRKDPPDRLSLVIEERQPVLWLVRPEGVFLLSDDGYVLDRVNQGNISPIPVVSDLDSQADDLLPLLISISKEIRLKQKDFYDRVTEFRWSERGPVVYLEGLDAPIYLPKRDVTKNIPNFQGLYLDQISKRVDLKGIRYIDLRWDEEIAVGEPADSAPPAQKSLPDPG